MPEKTNGSSNGAAAPSQAQVDQLKSKFQAAGQAHVFAFWDKLTEGEKTKLYKQLSELDVDRINRIFKKATTDVDSGSNDLEPLPASVFESLLSTPAEKIKEWEILGYKLIAENSVGVLLMAGGQGTRLGSSAPKGCYDIKLPSTKSLFQLQAERILRLQIVAAEKSGKSDVVIPWYVMTSGPTRPATEAFFKEHNFFGLKGENVIFFEQGTLPCYSNDGKILLESKSSLAVAPDGNGGIYAALRNVQPPNKYSVLDDAEHRGVKHLHAYCVDNCLVRVADPVFIGYCASKNAQCAAKTVPKAKWDEPVGVVARRGGKFGVIEYSEIDESIAKKTQPNAPDQLAFGAANIANHYYSLDFLKKVESFEDGMAYHIAKKKIKHTDTETGKQVSPSKPNGIKLELFVFDVFPFASEAAFAVLEGDRADEFSPLKNAPGTGADDPETSRRDILAQHRRFLTKAGAKFASDDIEIELSPLTTYSGEGLEAAKGKTFSKNAIINSAKELAV